MAITIDWSTQVITVPQADLTLISGSTYEHDVDAFHRALSDILDSEEGQPQLPTHRHTTELVLAGVTYARAVEIINGYTVTYENGNYRVNLVGANNNIVDVLNYNSVQVVSNNSAGLIVKNTGSGLTANQHTWLEELHYIMGLRAGYPMTVTPTSRSCASISQDITGDGVMTTTVTRT